MTVKMFLVKVSTLEIVTAARDAGQVVCAYASPYSSRFSAGFVEGATQKHVILRSMTTGGRADGWLLRPLDDIARSDWRGQHEKRLLFSAQMRETRWSETLPSVLPSTDPVFEVLQAAHKAELPVQFDSGSDEPAEGFVCELSTDWATLDKIERNGSCDGYATIRVGDIEKILVDEQSLQDLALLCRHCGRGTGSWT